MRHPRAIIAIVAILTPGAASAQAPTTLRTRPIVEFDAATLPAELNAPSYRRVLGSSRPRLAACYQALIQRTPAAAGRQTWTLRFGPDGRAEATLVPGQSSLQVTSFNTCVASTLRRLQLDALGTTITVQQAIDFSTR